MNCHVRVAVHVVGILNSLVHVQNFFFGGGGGGKPCLLRVA